MRTQWLGILICFLMIPGLPAQEKLDMTPAKRDSGGPVMPIWPLSDKIEVPETNFTGELKRIRISIVGGINWDADEGRQCDTLVADILLTDPRGQCAGRDIIKGIECTGIEGAKHDDSHSIEVTDLFDGYYTVIVSNIEKNNNYSIDFLFFGTVRMYDEIIYEARFEADIKGYEYHTYVFHFEKKLKTDRIEFKQVPSQAKMIYNTK